MKDKPYTQPGFWVVYGPGLPATGLPAIGAAEMNIAFEQGRQYEKKRQKK